MADGGCSTGSALGPSRLSLSAASSAERPESRTTPSLPGTSAWSSAYQRSSADAERSRVSFAVTITTPFRRLRPLTATASASPGHRDRIPAGVTGHPVAHGRDPIRWRRPWSARLLLLPAVAVAGQLGLGHSDRQAQALRIFPPAETTLAVPAIGATAVMTLDVIGGDPTLSGGLGVGEIGSRRSSTGIRAAILTSMNPRGARELRSTDAAVRPASVPRTGVSPVMDPPPGGTAERAAAGLAGYTSSPSPLQTEGITPDGVSCTGPSCAAGRRLRAWLGIGRPRIMLIMRSLCTARTNALTRPCPASTPRSDHWSLATGLAGRVW